MPCPGLAATRVRIASCRAAAGKKIRRTPVGRTRARRPRRASPRPVEGKIRKRTLTRGSGPHPEMNQDVVCSYEVRAGRDSSGEALQHHRERRIRVGEGEAVPMLEMGLRHMAEGSTCEVVGSSNWAWGPVGLPAAVEGERDIPPDTDVHMLVTLHRCLPQMDGQELPWSEKVSTVTWRKENGNDHFRRREYQKAKRCYMKACEVFGGDYEAPANEVADHVAAGARAKALVADAAANLAAVHLALGDAPHAKEAAEGALVMAPGHVKSLYRLAKACLLMDEFKECEAALRQALQADPENAGVRQACGGRRISSWCAPPCCHLGTAKSKRKWHEHKYSEVVIECVASCSSRTGAGRARSDHTVYPSSPPSDRQRDGCRREAAAAATLIGGIVSEI
ncbi:unnamed protein product [Prorocentrum cordatum]|uniref:peptidylprolyl isomerase n=1 Tax=Prorocentrum cordatum TaxID=2364126 RepID=A0ABN9W7W6_9DINO|nr:unnamed protein product [Polarella glacialis]